MASRTQYIVGETAISVAINTALSIAFVFLAFHGMTTIPTRSITLDMAPQTFMVTLMGCLVPALLTRRRIRINALTWHKSQLQIVLAHLWGRAVIAALFLTVVVVLVCWLALPRLTPGGVTFHALLLCKATFGALLAAGVTPWAIRKVLR